MIIGIVSNMIWKIECFFDRVFISVRAGWMGLVALTFKFDEFFYSVFATLAGATDIFDESMYSNIANNVYAAFGVVVLFVMAYNFLLIVIDPDKSNGDVSVEKMLKNIVKVMLLITLLRPIFGMANALVSSFVDNNVIGKIIFSGAYDSGNSFMCSLDANAKKKNERKYNSKEVCESAGGTWTTVAGARVVADDSKINPMTGLMMSVYGSLFEVVNPIGTSTADDEYGSPSEQNLDQVNLQNWGSDRTPAFVRCPVPDDPSEYHIGDDRKCSNDSYGYNHCCTLQDAVDYGTRDGSYEYFKSFAMNWYYYGDDEGFMDSQNAVKFHFFTGLIIGVYMAYVLISFCIDLAVRAIKIGFYQIVAPLCIACMILPGPKKDIYTKWRSVTIKNYCLVFVRIIALYLGIYILSMLGRLLQNVRYPEYCGGFCKVIVWVFLMLGILTIIKKIPELIQELIGEDTGLGQTISDKLKDARSTVGKAAAVGGAGAVGAARGVKAAIDKRKKLKEKQKELQDKKDKLKDKEDALAKHKQKYGTVKDKRGQQLNAELEAAQNEVNEAAKAAQKAKKRTGLLSTLGSVAAGSMSSTFRAASHLTNGFGLGDWKKEFADAGKEIEKSAGGADTARSRREARRKHREEYAEAKKELMEKYGLTEGQAKQRLKEIAEHKKNAENQKQVLDSLNGIRSTLNALGLSATTTEQFARAIATALNQPDMMNAHLELKNAKEALAQAEHDNARGENVRSAAEMEALRQAVSKAEAKVDEKTRLENMSQQLDSSGLMDASVKGVDVTALKTQLEDSLKNINVEFEALNPVNLKLETAKMAIETDLKIQSIQTAFANIVNPDQGAELKALQDIQSTLESGQKKAEDNAEKLLTKMPQAITVGVASSIEKIGLNPADGTGKILSDLFNGKNVRDIRSMSAQISECTDPQKLVDILAGEGISLPVTIPATMTDPLDIANETKKQYSRYLSELRSGLSSFDAAYGKACKSYVIDGCASGEIKISDPLVGEIASAATIASEAFTQAQLGSIFQTSSFGSTKSRKDSMDRLQEVITELATENAKRGVKQQMNDIRNQKDKK